MYNKTYILPHMADTHKQIIGRIGEEAAGMFLKKHLFSIIDTNYRRPWGEIDIIAQKGDCLRFVEVKTVSRESLPTKQGDDYEPEDNIHPWKRQRLRRIIQTYLAAKKYDGDWQVDSIAVYLNKEGIVLKIDWLEDILL